MPARSCARAGAFSDTADTHGIQDGPRAQPGWSPPRAQLRALRLGVPATANLRREGCHSLPFPTPTWTHADSCRETDPMRAINPRRATLPLRSGVDAESRWRMPEVTHAPSQWSGNWGREMTRGSVRRSMPTLVMLAGIATVLSWPGSPDPPVQSPSAQPQGPTGYVAQPLWDGYSSAVQDSYLAWDLLVWQVEQTSPPVATLTVAAPFNVVAIAIRDVMLQPGYDDLKRRLATSVSVGRRPHYLPYLSSWASMRCDPTSRPGSTSRERFGPCLPLSAARRPQPTSLRKPRPNNGLRPRPRFFAALEDSRGEELRAALPSRPKSGRRSSRPTRPRAIPTPPPCSTGCSRRSRSPTDVGAQPGDHAGASIRPAGAIGMGFEVHGGGPTRGARIAA